MTVENGHLAYMYIFDREQTPCKFTCSDAHAFIAEVVEVVEGAVAAAPRGAKQTSKAADAKRADLDDIQHALIKIQAL